MSASIMEWRVCVDFPAYEVSDCGDVRTRFQSASRRVGWRLRGSINFDGYLEYGLRDATGAKHHVRAHVLVAATFIGPKPTPAHEVAHGNGSRLCNCVWNLRWATRAENDQDTVLHGTARRGSRNGRAKLTAEDVVTIRADYLAVKRSRGKRRVSELAERYAVSNRQIVRIARNEAWTHVAEQRA